MIENLRTADANCERLLDLRIRFRIVSIPIERPGISIQSPDVMTYTDLTLCDAQCLRPIAGVIRVVEDECTVGICRLVD